MNGLSKTVLVSAVLFAAAEVGASQQQEMIDFLQSPDARVEAGSYQQGSGYAVGSGDYSKVMIAELLSPYDQANDLNTLADVLKRLESLPTAAGALEVANEDQQEIMIRNLRNPAR